MQEVDGYLSKMWNETNTYMQILEENFWDICRILEREGFVVSDDAPISNISIGPFKIASTLDIKKKDFLIYFLETIFPVILTKVSSLPFDQAYCLYILPAFKLLIDLANNCYWVKDLLQWEILMYIKKENQHGIYPTANDIKKSEEFTVFEEWQMEDALKKLKNFKNVLGDKHELIKADFEGRIECLA